MGLSLSGGKADKACLAVVDYFPEHRKIFLTKIFEKIKNEESISADTKIVELIEQHKEDVMSLAFDVPWRFPACLTSTVECPGVEVCEQPHIKWQRDFLKALEKKKKGRRIPVPYTQRCADLYLSHALEEPFDIGHAMGANVAPLLARALFLQRRIKVPLIEAQPRVALWRIGRSLNISKSHLRFHRHSVGGDESRKLILEALNQKAGVFIYEQDRKLMVENNHAFEALICALTGYLKYSSLTEPRPKDFPREEDWVEIPTTDIVW